MEITKAFLAATGGMTAWMIIMCGTFYSLEWLFSLVGINTSDTGLGLIFALVSLGFSTAVMTDVVRKFGFIKH